MKKLTFVLLTVALVALTISSVYAKPDKIEVKNSDPEVPEPTMCGCVPGYTPGFWKHNIRVLLDLTNGKHSSYDRGTYAGIKITDPMMTDPVWGYLNRINVATGESYTYEQFLSYLNEPGWSADRTNAANWLNWAIDLGPFQ